MLVNSTLLQNTLSSFSPFLIKRKSLINTFIHRMSQLHILHDFKEIKSFIITSYSSTLQFEIKEISIRVGWLAFYPFLIIHSDSENTFIDFYPKFALICQFLICIFISTVYLLDLAYLNKNTFWILF